VTIGNPDIRSPFEWLRPYVPPENVTMIDQILAQPDEASLGSLIVEFFVALLVSAIFSTLGGLIGGALFKRAAAAPDTPVPLDGPPPSAPAF
jgi:hypothetical protein